MMPTMPCDGISSYLLHPRIPTTQVLLSCLALNEVSLMDIEEMKVKALYAFAAQHLGL